MRTLGEAGESFFGLLTSGIEELEGANVDAIAAAIEGITEAAQRNREATVDWLAEGDNFLGFWVAFDDQMNQGAAALDGTIAQLEALQAAADIRANVDLALDLTGAQAAMDQVLRTFDQIDQLGSRTSAAGAIADALFGPDGDPWDAIGPLRDAFDAGRISYEQFLETTESGIAIQEASADAQLILTEIHADQLPLLEQENQAYVEQLERIAALEPAEQRRVLMLQDSAVQAELASVASLSYAASVGEIPEEVATQMILEKAEADAGLKELLLDLELITEEDGVVSVNFPGADDTVSAINRVTQSLLLLQSHGDTDVAMNMAIELWGKEEAEDLFGKVDEADGKKVTQTIETILELPETGGGGVGQLLGIIGGVGADVATDLSRTATLTINAEDNATSVMDAASERLAGMQGDTSTLMIDGDASAALVVMSGTDQIHQALDSNVATVFVEAVDNASGVINSVSNSLAGLDGDRATTYVDTVRTTVFRTVGSNTLTRSHGGMVGVPEFAGGGMVPFWAGENGAELAHFAGGGTALLPHEGMYAAPPMTYISPANAVSNDYGGNVNVYVTVQGNVTAERDLTASIAREVSEAMVGSVNKGRRGHGG